MESFLHIRKGQTPTRLHADLDGLKDDEIGRGGFTGRTVSMYRRHDPTAFRSDGPLVGTDVMTSALQPTDATDARGEPLLLYSNQDCRIMLSRRAEAMPFYARYIDGDVLAFVHSGSGTIATELGTLAYRPGDYVYLPKSLTFQQLPDEPSTLLMVEAVEEFRVPEPGVTGRHFPFDSGQIVLPEIDGDADLDREGDFEVRLYHHGGPTTLHYPHTPLDVVGWRGDNFPFTFNIDAYTPLSSDRVHLPPTIHLFMQATGVYIMNFLPRPAEGAAGTERVPWYHRNADFDEIAFYHGGSVFGVDLPAGLISHAPQGIHHGVPERARERARRTHDEYDTVDWKIISIDTRGRLTPSDAVLQAAGIAANHQKSGEKK